MSSRDWMPPARSTGAVGPLGAWLRDDLMPRWMARLTPPLGMTGYPQWLDAEGYVCWPESPLMLPQARLVYVLAHAALLGQQAAGDLAVRAMDTLNAAFWWDDWSGWRMGLAPNRHAVLDTYDQAFGLFALAWLYRLTGETEHRQRAARVHEALAQRRHPAGGFPEHVGPGANRPSVRRQNPHMHLLEAMLAWHEADPTGPWLQSADELVFLAKQRFIDRETGSIREFLDIDLGPAPGELGAWREPGHQLEWVWLLWLHAQASGHAFPDNDAQRLMAFAHRHGQGTRSRMVDVVHANGAPLDTQARLWPQTEWLKAELAMADRSRASLAGAMQAWHVIADQYLCPEDPSRWRNRLDDQGCPTEPVMPVRVLYHLFLATAEADRLLPPSLAAQARSWLPSIKHA